MPPKQALEKKNYKTKKAKLFKTYQIFDRLSKFSFSLFLSLFKKYRVPTL